MISQFVIAIAVCAGAYFFLVDPAKNRLAMVRAQVSKALLAENSDSAAARISLDQLKSIQDATLARARLIDDRSRLARNDSELFQAVSDLAQAHSVRVNQLSPVTLNTTGRLVTPTPAAPPDPKAPAPPKDTSAAYQIDATGTYPMLTSFIAALGRELGFTRVVSVRLNPMGEPQADQLRAEIRTEHFAFDLTALLGAKSTGAPTPTPTPAPARPLSHTTTE
jgi:hypothetical protein